MKTKALANQYCHDFIPYIWYGLVVSVVYILFGLLSADGARSLEYQFKETFFMAPYIITVVTMVGISFNYGRFKLAMQNGVSRKTFWKAKLLFIAKAALIVNVVNVIISFINMGMGPNETYLYYQAYGKAFSSVFAQSISMFITDYVVLLFIFIVMNTFGTMTSLMNKIGKSIFYSIGVVCYMFLTNLLTQYSSQRIISRFYARINGDAILNFIFSIGVKVPRPYPLIGFTIVLAIIAALFNLLFTKLEQVKR
ncbi:hypothetical protein RZ54_09700 [Apilactobacillus kunkeei]|uniref:hypothetical protein n=1 Tax=Apilactobacillus kunkeei TaxID=148814 RepID=UPI0006C3AAAA|nr:hypothetical protein [Apilactobacillus kunkeei]KOY74973.1 hypothetical protein RZ54_09700 [Apilactobacillus kunkeei]